MTRWIYRRSKLNHDVLKNQLVPSLGALENAASGLLDAEISPLVERVCMSWAVTAVVARELADSHLVEASPLFLFEEPPLCYCCPETRKWLPKYLYDRWASATGASSNLEAFRNTIAETERLIGAMRAHASLNCVRSPHLAKDARLCRISVVTLSMRLSDLPAFEPKDL